MPKNTVLFFVATLLVGVGLRVLFKGRSSPSKNAENKETSTTNAKLPFISEDDLRRASENSQCPRCGTGQVTVSSEGGGLILSCNSSACARKYRIGREDA